MTTTIDLYSMRVYRYMRRLGLGEEVALKAQRIAIAVKTRDVACWRTFQTRRLIDIGFTADEARAIRGALDREAFDEPETPAPVAAPPGFLESVVTKAKETGWGNPTEVPDIVDRWKAAFNLVSAPKGEVNQ